MCPKTAFTLCPGRQTSWDGAQNAKSTYCCNTKEQLTGRMKKALLVYDEYYSSARVWRWEMANKLTWSRRTCKLYLTWTDKPININHATSSKNYEVPSLPRNNATILEAGAELKETACGVSSRVEKWTKPFEWSFEYTQVILVSRTFRSCSACSPWTASTTYTISAKKPALKIFATPTVIVFEETGKWKNIIVHKL